MNIQKAILIIKLESELVVHLETELQKTGKSQCDIN